MAALFVLLIAASPTELPFGNPEGPIYSTATSAPVVTPAAVEVANASGTGMTAACACTATTTVGGTAIASARASSATCLKRGLASTGIQNGDAVVCGSNIPRAESDGAVVGLLHEPSRTNYALSSRAMVNPSYWTTLGNGIAAPTVTADYAVSPDGTMNAARVIVPACPTSGTYSILYQGVAGVGGNTTVAISGFIKGTSGSGTVAFYGGGSGLGGITCSFNSTSWTWCGGPNAPFTMSENASGWQVGYGCTNNGAPNTGDTGAADFLVWGMQMELGTFPTHPIFTTTAAVTRASEILSIDQASLGTTLASGSMSAYITLEDITTADQGWLTLNDAALNVRTGMIAFPTGGSNRVIINAGATNVNAAVTVPRATTTKVSGTWGSSGRTACVGAACVTSAAVTESGTLRYVALLDYGAGGFGTRVAPGLISRICIDPDPARCSP